MECGLRALHEKRRPPNSVMKMKRVVIGVISGFYWGVTGAELQVGFDASLEVKMFARIGF